MRREKMLSREETVTAIERNHPAGIPVWYDYFADETKQKYPYEIERLIAEYPDDMIVATREDQQWNAGFSHAEGGVGMMATEHPLASWDELDEFIARVPLMASYELRESAQKKIRENPDRYFLGHWWCLYFETLCQLRGVDHAFMDVLVERENVNRLFDALEEYFLDLSNHFKTRYHADGIWFGDDYGMQDRLMISPEAFREVFKPRLRTIFDKVHSQGMHAFMHSCGNIEMILPDLIEIGCDVIHPIQPGTMDLRRLVDEYHNDITFFVGVDVQKTLSFGTVPEIKAHVENLFSLFDIKCDGFLMTSANTIMPETPLENITALFETLHAVTKNGR